MEIGIPAATITAYSVILTYVIDFLSEIPALSKVVTGTGKRITAIVVGIAFCIISNTSVLSKDTQGEIITGLLLAATAGLIISKGSKYAKAKKDLAVSEVNGI